MQVLEQCLRCNIDANWLNRGMLQHVLKNIKYVRLINFLT